MPAGNRQKLKLLYLMQILQEETDEQHGLSMPQLIERLEEKGISAERKGLYRDIEALREFGFDVRSYHRHPVEYGVASREFELSELGLIIDAVQSSRFLSDGKSKALVKSVKQLASAPQRVLLNKQVHVHGRPKNQALSEFNNVDRIQEAISQKSTISFHYFRYNHQMKKANRHGEEPYVVTPVCLVYSDDFYYMVAYSEKHDGFANYRVDRMERIVVTGMPAAKNERIATFDPSELGACAFGMYSGQRVSVTLRVESSAMNVVVDRFGKDLRVSAQDDETALITVPVMVSPVFFGWLAQLGTQVKIERPASLVTEYSEYLRAILGNYAK